MNYRRHLPMSKFRGVGVTVYSTGRVEMGMKTTANLEINDLGTKHRSYSGWPQSLVQVQVTVEIIITLI